MEGGAVAHEIDDDFGVKRAIDNGAIQSPRVGFSLTIEPKHQITDPNPRRGSWTCRGNAGDQCTFGYRQAKTVGQIAVEFLQLGAKKRGARAAVAQH